jgi:hypothetical protein
MTIASRGRSMKIEEIIAQLRWRGDAGAGDRRVRSRPLDSLDDDLLSFLEALDDAGRLRRHLAEAYPALPGDILVVDDIHIAALLISEDRGARYGDDRLRLYGFKKDGDELVGHKLAKVDTARRFLPPDGIRNDPAEKECVGVLRDRVVDEVELPGLVIDPPVREAKSDLHRVESALPGIRLA